MRWRQCPEGPAAETVEAEEEAETTPETSKVPSPKVKGVKERVEVPAILMGLPVTPARSTGSSGRLLGYVQIATIVPGGTLRTLAPDTTETLQRLK